MEQLATLNNLNINHLIIITLLVILSLFLKRFIPPIKEQYQVIVLVIIGGILGYYLINNTLIGVCISGLVFYKDTLVKELLLIKDSFVILKDEIEKDKK